MRKVYADVDLTVLLPVRIKGHIIVRANEGANVGRAIRQLIANKRCTTADLELAELNVVQLGDETIDLPDIDVLELISFGKPPHFHNIEVTDSR